MNKVISIIIPCYNEAENIKHYKYLLFPVLDKFKKNYEVIFVNDGSIDSTSDALKRTKAAYSDNVCVISYDKNKGLGYALRQGINAAKGDLVIPLDADLTFNPAEINKLLARFNVGDCDCVIGSHFLKGGKLEKVASHRVILSKLVNVIYCVLLAENIKSISSIFRLYKADDIKNLNLSATGFDINAEILYKLLKQNKKVVEVPVVLTSRKYGQSKLNTKKEIVNHVKLIMKILVWKLGFMQ